MCSLSLMMSSPMYGMATIEPITANSTNLTDSSLIVEQNGPVISNFTVTPDYAEVGDVVTISFELQDESEISYVYGSLLGPSSVKDVYFEYDETKGIWSGTYQVEGNTESGIYNIEVNASDIQGNYTHQNFSEKLEIYNPNADLEAPVIESVEVTPSNANAGEEVRIKAKVSDDQSGVDYIYADIEIDGNYRSITMDYNETENVYEASYVIKGNDPSGQAVIGIGTSDISGNFTYQSYDGLLEINNPDGDFVGPIIETVEVTPSIANVGDEVRIKAKVTDDSSGVEYIYAGLDLGEQYRSVTMVYNETLGIYEGTYIVKASDPSGSVQLNIGASDTVGNYSYQTYNDLLEVNNPNGDFTAPIIESFEVTPNIANVGDRVEMKAKITDDVSGVESVHTSVNIGDQTRYVDMVYNQTAGLYEGFYTVQQSDPSGPASLNIYVTDTAGNSDHSSFTEKLEINNTNGDFNAPNVETVEVTPNVANVGDKVTIKAKITDDISGVENVNANVKIGEQYRYVDIAYNSITQLYEGIYTVQQNDPSGSVDIVIDSRDVAGNYGSSTHENLLEINNPNGDFIAPVIESVEVTPNIANAGDEIVVTAKVTDNNSGVDSVGVDLYFEGQYRNINMYYNPSKDVFEGVYKIRLNDPSGPAEVYINTRDKAGNNSYKSYDNLLEINNPDGDFAAPTVDNVSVNLKEATVGDTIEIRADIKDDNSGVSNVSTIVFDATGDGVVVEFNYDEKSGQWVGYYEITSRTRPGVRDIEFTIEDYAGNVDWHTSTSVFKVTNLDGDFEAPKLQNIEVTSEQVNVGDILTIEAEVSDNKSGVDSVHAEISDVEGRSQWVYFYYNSRTGKWEGQVYISSNFRNGQWTVSSVGLGDKEGNYDTVDSNIVFTVNNPDGDFEAPTITNITFSDTQLNVGDKVTITADVNDVGTGVKEVNGNFYFGYTSKEVQFVYDPSLKIWVGTYIVQENDMDGIGEFYLEASDFNDNETYFWYENPVSISNPNGDFTPPTLETFEASPQEVNVGEKVNFTVKANDDQSGIAVVKVDSNIGTQYLRFNPTTGLWEGSKTVSSTTPPGEHGVHVYLIDKKGNEYSDYFEGAMVVQNNEGDFTAPTLTSLNIDSTTYNVGDTITIEVGATDDQSAVTKVTGVIGNYYSSRLVELTFDQSKGVWIGDYTFTEQDQPGNLLVNALLEDEVGNTIFTEENVSFELINEKYDSLPPEISQINVSPKNVQVGEKVQFEVKVTDEDSVTNVGIDLYNGNKYENIELTYDEVNQLWKGQYTVDEKSQDGYYSVEVYAVDTNGNYSRKLGTSIFVNKLNGDNVAPIIEYSQISSTLVGAGEEVKISAKVSDNHQLNEVYADVYLDYYSDYHVTVPLTLNIQTGLYEGILSFESYAQPGVWNVDITANDHAGNEKSKTVGSFVLINDGEIDVEGPTINNLEISKTTAVAGETITFKADVQDDLSGVKAIEVYLEAGLSDDYGAYQAIPLTFDEAAGLWIGEYTVQPTDAIGTRRVMIDAVDMANNYNHIFNKESIQIAKIEEEVHSENFGVAQWYYEQKSFYNAVYYANLAFKEGDKRQELVDFMIQAAGALYHSAATMETEDAKNAYQLLVNALGVPSEIKENAQLQLNPVVTSPKYDEAVFYFENQNYYNAVYYAGVALAEGDSREVVKTLLNNSAEALFEAASNMTTVDAENAYRLLVDSVRVPVDIKTAAEEKLSTPVFVSPHMATAVWYFENNNFYNAVHFVGLALKEGDTRTETVQLLSDAATSLFDAAANMNSTDAQNSFTLLVETEGVPSDIKRAAKEKLSTTVVVSPNFGTAKWYFDNSNLYNAVYFAGLALKDGDNRTETVQLMNNAATELLEATSTMAEVDAKNAYTLLVETVGVPEVIKTQAEEHLNSGVVISPNYLSAVWYLENDNYYNAVYFAELAILDGDVRPEVQEVMNTSAQSLYDAAANYSFVDAQNAYQLLVDTADVPEDIKVSAQSKIIN